MEKKGFRNVLKSISSGLRAAERYLCEDLDAICDDTMRKYAEETLVDVRRSLKEIEQFELKGSHEIASEVLKDDGYFYITSVHRDDLEAQGFDVSNVSDAQMLKLAEMLSDDYCEQLFWTSVDSLAEYVGMTKRDDAESEDDNEE